MLLTYTHTFADGVGPAFTASGSEVMVDFNEAKAVINALDEANITAGSKIMVTDRAKTVSAVLTFGANPVFNAGGIADAALTANVPLLNANNVFTSDNQFNKAILKLRLPKLAAHPTLIADDNLIYEYTSDGNCYVFKFGTGAIRVDYVGGYTGGALRSYSGMNVVDENSPIMIPIKCDVGFSSVKISLIGKDFPSYIYTELPRHNHGVGTLALANGTVNNVTHTHDTNIGHTHSGTFGSSTHTHSGLSHTHTFSDTSSGTSVNHHHGVVGSTQAGTAHNHAGIEPGTGYTNAESAHTHPMNFNSGNQSAGHTHTVSGNTGATAPSTNAPSATASVSSFVGSKTSGAASYGIAPNVSTTIAGSVANAGILGNVLNDTKKTVVTTAIKTYVTQDMANWGIGWDSGTYAALLNINNANGTGEIDITAKCLAGFNYIKIVDETVKKGGTIMWHIDSV